MNRVYSLTKCYFIALLLLLVCDGRALADSQAVQKTNAQIGYASWDSSVSSVRVNNSYSIYGDITFPLTTYLGASLSGGFGSTKILPNANTNVTPTTTGPDCTVSNDSLDAKLFVRDPTLGKIGVNYGAGRQQSRCSGTFLVSGTDSQSTTAYGLSAEYYLSKVTLAVAVTKTQLDPNSDFASDALAMNWYPLDDLRVELSAFGQDLQDTYKVGLEYRPGFLDDSIGLLLAYSIQNQTTEVRTIMFGINYFFEKHIPLITRDRYFR